MKKLLCLLVAAGLLLSANCAVFADDVIEVYLNGNEIVFDQAPILQNERTLVPMRKIFEALGADVYWIESKQVILGVKNDIKIIMQIGDFQLSKLIVPVGQPEEDFNASYRDVVELEAAPVLINERTLVPVRAISEAFDIDVGWDEANTSVNLSGDDTSANTDKEFVKVFERYMAGELRLKPSYPDTEVTGKYIEFTCKGENLGKAADIVRMRLEAYGYNHSVAIDEEVMTVRTNLLDRNMTPEEQNEFLLNTIAYNGYVTVEDYAGNLILDSNDILRATTASGDIINIKLTEAAASKVEAINEVLYLKINMQNRFVLKMDGQVILSDNVNIDVTDERKITITNISDTLDCQIKMPIINFGAYPGDFEVSDTKIVG